jgi:hypothetical protein
VVSVVIVAVLACKSIVIVIAERAWRWSSLPNLLISPSHYSVTGAAFAGPANNRTRMTAVILSMGQPQSIANHYHGDECNAE